MNDRFSKFKGKRVLIFTKNGFRIAGKMTECDDKFVEVFDEIKGKFKIVSIDNISEVEAQE